jgi:hypothetical protein
MGVQLTTLSASDLQRFERDGYLVVRQAFARADGLAMEQQWWRELAEAHGIRPDEPASWRQLPGDLNAAKRDRTQARILTTRVRGVLDDLLGPGAWPPPRDWGRPLVTFPGPGQWELPTGNWHWDNPAGLHLDRPRALFVVSFIGSVGPRGGGTLILSGSPRLLIEQERRLTASERRGSIATLRDRFHRSHPWLMALTGSTPSPTDRIAAFMDRETLVDGVPLQVVELTGEPGDMVFCHPVMVHCVAPNRGARPRFMRIKTQILTHQGRELRDALHWLRQSGGNTSDYRG